MEGWNPLFGIILRIIPKLRTYVAVSCQESGLLLQDDAFPGEGRKRKPTNTEGLPLVRPCGVSIGFSRNAFLETCKRTHPDANPGHCRNAIVQSSQSYQRTGYEVALAAKIFGDTSKRYRKQ